MQRADLTQWEQFGVQDLAQEHFDMWTGWAVDWTSITISIHSASWATVAQRSIRTLLWSLCMFECLYNQWPPCRTDHMMAYRVIYPRSMFPEKQLHHVTVLCRSLCSLGDRWMDKDCAHQTEYSNGWWNCNPQDGETAQFVLLISILIFCYEYRDIAHRLYVMWFIY